MDERSSEPIRARYLKGGPPVLVAGRRPWPSLANWPGGAFPYTFSLPRYLATPFQHFLHSVIVWSTRTPVDRSTVRYVTSRRLGSVRVH